MNKWRLLLFAVFCIFQPISTENLFNGRERCLQQRPEFCRKDSRLLEYQSKARPEIRRVNRNGREFSERVNAEYPLRFSERTLNNRDENIGPEDHRSRSNDRIRVSLISRQRISKNVYEDRLGRRSLKNERSEPELRNAQEERRLNTERQVRYIRLTRSLTQESRQNNEREDTRARNTISRDSQFVYAPNRRIVERHFDNIQDRLISSRHGRYLNERRESRSTSRGSHVQEGARANTEVVYDRFLRTDDLSRRNNERLQREFQENVLDNRRQNERPESVIRASFNNEIRRQRTPATSWRVTEQRSSVQRRESDESRAFRRELRESLNEASERIVRFDDSRRQINERLTRGQRNVPANRRNNIRLELPRTDKEEINRQNSPTTVNRAFEGRESAQKRKTDESRQLRRELRAYSNRAYERESVQRRESEESRDLRRELRDSADKANKRYIRSDDSIRRTEERAHSRTQRNIRPEFIRTHNSEFNRRISPVTTRYDTERKNEAGEHHNFRWETFKRRESAQKRKTDESLQLRRELRAYSNRAYERESVQRKESEESHDLRRELRDSPDKANERYIRSDDSIRRTKKRIHIRAQRNIRPEFIRTHNSEFNRRSSPVTTRYDTERRNEAGEHLNFRRETRNSDIADSRLDSHTSRNIRWDARQKSKMNVSRNYNVEISQRSYPVSMMYVDDRAEYLHRRDLDTSRDFRRETRAQRSDDGDRRSSPNSVRNISERREFVERSDDTRHSRINERLQSRNRRERQNNIWSQFVPNPEVETKRSFAAVTRDAIETRESRQRDNLDESRNFRREVRAVRLDDSSRRDGERLNTRVQRDVLQSTRDSNIRALNVELRQDNKRVDENRRTARVTIRDSRVAKVVRDENEASRYNVRDKEISKERSLDRTDSMLIRRQLEKRIQRDTSRRTRSNDSNVLKDTFDQIIRAVSQNNREDERNVERRVRSETPQNYRFESRYLKNTFERNVERDSSKRLLDDSIGNRRDSRRASLFSRDNQNSAKNVRDSKNFRKEIRLSMAPHNVPSEEASDLSFKWQHLLYLLQAAYIVGLLAKLPQAEENFEKKTRIGIWNNSPKLIKVD